MDESDSDRKEIGITSFFRSLKQGMEPTASSVRSCVAPAFRRRLMPGVMPCLLTRQSKQRVAAIIFAVALFIHFAPRAASACTCKPFKDGREAFDHAEVVFVGNVISVTKPKPRIVGRRRKIIEVSLELVVRFKVERTWKFATRRYLTLTTMAQTAACGNPFKVGEKYLVFATADLGGVRTGLCSGSADFAHAQTYLEQIGPGKLIRANRTSFARGPRLLQARHNKSLDARLDSVFLNLLR